MSASGKPRKPARRLRPLRRIRKAAGRLRRHIAATLGLGPVLADRGYMICATSRSGSTYLAQLLSSTGLLGNPREYFNTHGWRRRFEPDYPTSRRAQLKVIRTRGATSNGIYAVKVIAPQLLELNRRIDPFRDLPNLSLLVLRRRDLLGQAISLARARQTGQYLATDRQRANPAYDAQAIRKALASIQRQDSIWDAALAHVNVPPLSFVYEDVLADPQAVVDEIAVFMGLAPPVPIDRGLVTHAMQRDAQNATWRERFLAETGDEFRHLANR